MTSNISNALGTTKFYSESNQVDEFLSNSDECLLELKSFEEIKEFFELDRCYDWIEKNEYKRVALQFPDCYLKYAFEVTQFLEKSEASIFVLGDTSYGSCCVDEVTAEHAACDALIHFGDACLSTAVKRIPILYIFCRYKMELCNFKEKLLLCLAQKSDEPARTALLFDSAFAHMGEIKEWFSENVDTIFDLAECEEENTVIGRRVPPCVLKWENATLIFVGFQSSPLLMIFRMTFVQFSKVIHFIPKEKRLFQEDSRSLTQLKRRLFLIEKLKDAKNVGLVVGTLGVQGFREAIDRVRMLCKTAQKRLYVFSIGKINEAKLSNFSDNVDAFILLSCPYGIILNTNDFHKPILSLFEAEIALNSGKSWFPGSGWTSQFKELLSDDIGSGEDESVDVSLITGRIRITDRSRSGGDDGEDRDGDKRKQMIQYSADEYFANRSWRGLEDECTNEADTTLKKGLQGLPVGYRSENN